MLLNRSGSSVEERLKDFYDWFCYHVTRKPGAGSVEAHFFITEEEWGYIQKELHD